MASTLSNSQFVLTVVLALWLIQAHSLKTLNCVFYDERCNQVGNGHPAIEYCNRTTKECRDDNPGTSAENTFCYSLISRNEHGNLSMHKSDCWVHEQEGHNCKSSICEYSEHAQLGYLYCCCQGDLCNSRPLTLPPVSNPKPSISPSLSRLPFIPLPGSSTSVPTGETAVECDVRTLTGLMTAFIVLSTGVVVLVVILAVRSYRKGRLSTELPESGIAHV
ncbi:activin receptor type-2B-like [Corticium candelabrum]|uniref:activin receptor type-2B-like n=1 Tax=Corticium candelabrum TaxID=121492 RepID=UPI002E2748A1|nr:activin receptor type-2B-like [Corticium candelabrum]